MTRRRAEPRCLAVAIACVWASLAHAQQDAAAAPAGAMVIRPRVGWVQTWTDNLRLDDQNKDAALITTLSPGISLVSNSGLLRGSLDYSLNGIAYVKSDQPSRLQNALNANLQAEVISRTLFVDMRATIGQQSTSAFGLQTTPTLGSQGSFSDLANENRRETGTLSVSPRLRGMLGGVASYELRGEFARTETRRSSLGDSRSQGGSLSISEWNPGVLGWWLLVNRQRVTSSSSLSNRNDSLKLGLSYRPDVDWVFTVGAGQERNDLQGDGNRNGATGSASAEWTPTLRTRVLADYQRHNYGNTHSLSFEHRMARSVWRLSDSQSVTLGNIGPAGGARTVYDQFFALFASIEPDPVKRDARVREFLQLQGLSPDSPVGGGFLSAGPSRLRSQVLAVTLQGVRSTLTAQFNRSLTRRVGSSRNEGTLADTSKVEQRSYMLTASHRLTPLSAISLTASRQQSTGDLGNQSIKLTSLTGSWSVRLGRQLSGQLGARHTRFEGVTPYTENAAYANLTQQF